MEQRKWGRDGIEGFLCQPQHDRGVFANGIEHYRSRELSHHLTQDLDALRFQLFEMRKDSSHTTLSSPALNVRGHRRNTPQQHRRATTVGSFKNSVSQSAGNRPAPPLVGPIMAAIAMPANSIVDGSREPAPQTGNSACDVLHRGSDHCSIEPSAV